MYSVGGFDDIAFDGYVHCLAFLWVEGNGVLSVGDGW